MTQLQLSLVNNSSTPGNLVVYQRLDQATTALAWFSKYAYPNTQFTFGWDSYSYCFVWSGTGQLGPGIVFSAAQVVPATLQDSNEIGLSYDQQHKVFFFKDQQAGSQAGVFTIKQDASIPANAAAVGIGMAGKPTFVVQCLPNSYVSITPRQQYWVTFGNIEQGQFLDDIENLHAVQVIFPPNVNSMTVTLNADNTWSVTSNILAKVEPEDA